MDGKLTQSSISYYERGTKKPEAATVFLLAQALGANPREAMEALMADIPGMESVEIERTPDPDREMWVGAYDGLTEPRRKILLELAAQLRQDEKETTIG
jgi:transcriptional regulator with XRE-family HTH domain